MAVRGPTREALQEQCVVAPVKDAQNLRSYFHGVRQLLFQAESYYVEGQLVQVSAVWAPLFCASVDCAS